MPGSTRRLLQFVQRGQNVVAVRFHIHCGPHFPDDAVRIDQVGMPGRKLRHSQIHHRVILSRDFLIRVRQKLEGQALFCAKLLVRLLILHAHAENHGVLRLILGQVALEIVGFDRAPGGHILRIKIEHHPLALEIMQADGLSFLRIQCKVRRRRPYGRRFVSAAQIRAYDGEQSCRRQNHSNSRPHWFFPHVCLSLKLAEMSAVRPAERCAEFEGTVGRNFVKSRFDGTYFLAMGSFAGGGSGLGLGANRLASGLRTLQSAGGKETRQKRGLGSANSTPTSETPFAPWLRSTTLQVISSPVVTFVMLRVCPSRRGSCNCSSAPWAFTINVFACSTKGAPLSRLPETRNGTANMTLWLRRWLATGVGRISGALIGLLPLFYGFQGA